MITDRIRKAAEANSSAPLAEAGTPPTEIKREQSARVAADVEAYLKSGGQIHRLPGPGETDARPNEMVSLWADYETNKRRAAESGVSI
jgi:hypothetical protein